MSLVPHLFLSSHLILSPTACQQRATTCKDSASVECKQCLWTWRWLGGELRVRGARAHLAEIDLVAFSGAGTFSRSRVRPVHAWWGRGAEGGARARGGHAANSWDGQVWPDADRPPTHNSPTRRRRTVGNRAARHAAHRTTGGVEI